MAIKKAVFPVAGLATRFYPASKSVPKELFPLVDRPLLQYAVEEALEAGIEEFVFVSSKDKPAITDHFLTNLKLEETLMARGKNEAIKTLNKCTLEDDQIRIVYQDAPLGLGHAIWCAKTHIGDEPFAILLPDDIILSETGCLKQMLQQNTEQHSNMVATMHVPKDQVSMYGILDAEHTDNKILKVNNLIEKPAPDDAPSTLAIVGRYILQPCVLEYLDSMVKTFSGIGEIQLTDALFSALPNTPTYGYVFDGARYDCGHYAGYLEACVAYALRYGDQAEQLRTKLTSLLKAA